jgi:hypothetical protein
VIDVVGDVNICERGLTEIPYKFGFIEGSFFCSTNELVSLHNSPYEVTDFFICNKNKLINLIGSPRKVGAGFQCITNELTSLEGCPDYVGEKFLCHDNKMTKIRDLVVVPAYIGRYMNSDVKEANAFQNELLGKAILPNIDIFEDMEILYEEGDIKYYNPHALRAFIRQETPSMLSEINLKEIEDEFKEIGYVVI